jgi:hypothetical protein
LWLLQQHVGFVDNRRSSGDQSVPAEYPAVHMVGLAQPGAQIRRSRKTRASTATQRLGARGSAHQLPQVACVRQPESGGAQQRLAKGGKSAATSCLHPALSAPPSMHGSCQRVTAVCTAPD